MAVFPDYSEEHFLGDVKKWVDICVQFWQVWELRRLEWVRQERTL